MLWSSVASIIYLYITKLLTVARVSSTFQYNVHSGNFIFQFLRRAFIVHLVREHIIFLHQTNLRKLTLHKRFFNRTTKPSIKIETGYRN